MEADLKLVVEKQKADKIKQQLKKLMQQLDQDRSGNLKAEAFETVLGLHKVRLSKEGIATLLRECKPRNNVTGTKNDCLCYRDALQRISINMEVDEPMMKEWIVRSYKGGKEYSPVPSSVMLRSSYSKGDAGGLSTNQMLKQLNTITKTQPGRANSPSGEKTLEASQYSSEKPKMESRNVLQQ